MAYIGLEERRVSDGRLVLRAPGAEAFRQPAPEAVEAMVRHLEDPAEVRRLAAIEKEVRFRGVVVHAVTTLEEAERHQGVEKVVRRALVQSEPVAQRAEVLWMPGKLGEDAHLDGTQ